MSNKQQIIAKRFNGDEEKYKEWLRSLGAKGGRKSRNPPDHPSMFNNNRELASRAGKISQEKRRKAIDLKKRQA